MSDKAWSILEKSSVDVPPNVASFLDHIVSVCRRHGLWIRHEDEHGAFIVSRVDSEDWLRSAHLDLP